MLDRILLFPYSVTLALRNAYYRKHAIRPEAPAICLGNITVGGTGKTPHTEMILSMLQESDEWGARNLAVLSRGYRRRSRGFQQVGRDGSAAVFGDEPVQIKRKFPAVTVAVDRNRLEGCEILRHPDMLRARKYRKCRHKDFDPADMIVLDDALQYRKLKGDLEIMLVDYNRPVDEDRLLPLGSLRDLPGRMKDCDVVIVTKCPYEMEQEEKDAWARRLGITEGDGRRLFFTTVKYGELKPMFESSDTRYIYTKKAIIFSGIAKDRPFMRYLSDSYIINRRFSFGDHHKYTRADFKMIERAVRNCPTATVITTEKDAQRVMDIDGLPAILKERMFYQPISVDFLSDGEREDFRSLLTSIQPR